MANGISDKGARIARMMARAVEGEGGFFDGVRVIPVAEYDFQTGLPLSDGGGSAAGITTDGRRIQAVALTEVEGPFDDGTRVPYVEKYDWSTGEPAEGSGTVREPETIALGTRMSPAPDGGRLDQIDALVASLKGAGVWAKLDALYILAAHDSQAARLNWKGASYDLIAVNSPAFTIDRGYGDGDSAAYLDTGFNPSTAVGVQFTQDGAHLGVWNLTPGTFASSNEAGTTTGAVAGGNLRIIAATGTGAVAYRVNATTTIVTSTIPASAKGHKMANRSASNAMQAYSDGVQIHSSSTPSAAPDNDTIRGLRASVASARQLAAIHFGGSLTEGETAALYSALQTYMTAVGA